MLLPFATIGPGWRVAFCFAPSRYPDLCLRGYPILLCDRVGVLDMAHTTACHLGFHALMGAAFSPCNSSIYWFCPVSHVGTPVSFIVMFLRAPSP